MPALDLGSVVDLDRYPLAAPIDDPARQAVVARLRADLAADGVAILPGFLTSTAIERIAADADRLRVEAHLEDVYGTAYLGLPEDGYPDGHPRRTAVHSFTWVIAYDLVPADNPVRLLFEDDTLGTWLAEIIDRGPLHRMDDPLGALNLTVMEDGHVQGWHYDSTDFVVSMAIRASTAGGAFECAAAMRTDDDEHYDEVAAVLAGEAGDRVDVYPMTPGTLMVFEGRRSLHRVSPVEGDVGRVVALLGYDTRPGTTSSDLLKLVRYGRTEPLGTSA
jgi:hypothetical protein